MHEASDPRYLEYLQKLAQHPRMSAKQKVLVIDTYLTWQLQIGPPAQPEIVDQLSLQLLTLDDCISTRGTRGSVLIDLGRIEEGRAMLEKVLHDTDSPTDKSYSNIFLALARKQAGDTEGARRYGAEALRIDPACPALKRISDLVPGSSHPAPAQIEWLAKA